jgi:hypothetical protein
MNFACVYNRRQQSYILCGSLIAIFITIVHVHVTATGMGFAGFLLVFDHLFNIALVLALLILCSAVGCCMLACFRYKFDDSLEAILFSLAIGCGIVSVSILVLGFASSLSRVILAGLTVFWVFLVRRQILKVVRLSIQASVEFKEQSSTLTITIFGIVAVFMISRALLPPTDWDSLMYHLRLPADFLEVGKIFLPQDSLHVAYVQLVHMLYLLLLACGSVTGPALLSAFFALFLGLTVFAFARRFFSAQTAAFSFQLVWSSTIVLLIAITPRIDVTLAQFLFLAHFALLLAMRNKSFLYLSAVLLGFAVGIKHSALIYVLALSPIIVWVVWLEERRFAACLLRLFYFGVICLGFSLPWFAKNWWILGSPVYPFFARRQIDPWLAFLYSEGVIPASVDPKILTMLSEVRVPFNLIDLFASPGALSIEGEAAFYFFSPAFLCLVLWAVAFTKNRVLNALIIPAAGYVAVLTIFSPSTNLRYLIPAVAPLTLASAYLVIALVQRREWGKKAFIIVQCCILIVLFPTAVVIKLWTSNRSATDYLLGAASSESYLENNSVPPYYRLFATTLFHVNRHLPLNSRILMLFEARGFYFNVPVIQDNVLTNWPLLANRASKLNCLARTGITHVLVNFADLNYYLHRGLQPATTRWDVFEGFAAKCLIPVFRGPGHTLYEVRK